MAARPAGPTTRPTVQGLTTAQRAQARRLAAAPLRRLVAARLPTDTTARLALLRNAAPTCEDVPVGTGPIEAPVPVGRVDVQHSFGDVRVVVVKTAAKGSAEAIGDARAALRPPCRLLQRPRIGHADVHVREKADGGKLAVLPLRAALAAGRARPVHALDRQHQVLGVVRPEVPLRKPGVVGAGKGPAVPQLGQALADNGPL